MQDSQIALAASNGRTPWNKNKLIGPKPPLRPKHVWAIRTKLQIDKQPRDLAMFNLAIDSKLRGCDVVALKVEDIAPGGYAIEFELRRESMNSPGAPTAGVTRNRSLLRVDALHRGEGQPATPLTGLPIRIGSSPPTIEDTKC